jgi:hypothetical protein
MKRTDACPDCPVSLICIGGGMTVGEIFVCGECGGADFVANEWELKKIWLTRTADGHGDGGVVTAAIHIKDDCPRLIYKETKDGERDLVGMSDGTDDNGKLRTIRSTVYVCTECFKKKFSRSKQGLNFDAVFYYVNGRHRV